MDWRVALDYSFTPELMGYAQVSTGYKAGGINPRPYFEVQIESVQPEEITSYEVGFKSTLFNSALQFNASVSALDFEYTRVDPTVAVTEDMITPFTPELTYSLGIQYEYVMDYGSVVPRLDVSYQDEIYANPTNAETNRIDDYALVNGRISWRSFTNEWEASFEVNNLTDEVYYLNIYDQFLSSGSVEATVAKPRTYAVSIRRNF